MGSFKEIEQEEREVLRDGESARLRAESNFSANPDQFKQRGKLVLAQKKKNRRKDDDDDGGGRGTLLDDDLALSEHMEVYTWHATKGMMYDLARLQSEKEACKKAEETVKRLQIEWKGDIEGQQILYFEHVEENAKLEAYNR